MAFSIANIFSPKTPAPAPVAAPPAPGVTNNPANNTPTTGTQQSAGASPNGVIPNDGSANEGAKKESPMANFATLWEAPKTEAGKEDLGTPNTSLDPQKVMEAAGKVDFAKVVNPEVLTKITAGGEGAVTALIEALNKTSQTVFAQSTIAAQRIADNAVAAAEERFQTNLPQAIRRQQLSGNLVDSNPAFANPAIQPLVAALESQLSEKFPKATPKELQTMAQEYLTGAANLIVPPQKDNNPNPNDKRGKDNVDWDSWLTQ